MPLSNHYAENIHRCLTTVPEGIYFPNWNLDSMISTGTVESAYRFSCLNPHERIDRESYRGDWIIRRAGATVVICNIPVHEYIRCVLVGEFMAVRRADRAPFEIFRFDVREQISEPGIAPTIQWAQEGFFHSFSRPISLSVGSWVPTNPSEPATGS